MTFKIISNMTINNKYILISYGRSGSTFINETIGNIFNKKKKFNLSKELFGPNLKSMMKIDNPVKKIEDYFKYLEEKYPMSYLYGFKWKPYYLNSNYINIFEYLKKNNIKVIVNYRNPIHIIISGIKHAKNKNLQHHYNSKDKKGLLYARSIKVTIPTSNLIKRMEDIENNMKLYINYLKKYNISFLKVNYQELCDDEKYWKEIINFLSISKNDAYILKKTKLNKSLNNPKFQKTTVMKDYDLIENYNDVLKVLKGTKYNKYIDKKN